MLQTFAIKSGTPPPTTTTPKPKPKPKSKPKPKPNPKPKPKPKAKPKPNPNPNPNPAAVATAATSTHPPCTGDKTADEVIANTLLARTPTQKLLLACAIYTYQGHRKQLVETYWTWGKYCDHFFAYSNETFMFDRAASKTTIKLHQGEGQWFGTSRLIHKHLADKLDDGTLNFDFVTVAGDDSFFVLPNLRNYLSELPPLTKSNSFKTFPSVPPQFGYEYIGGIDSYRRNSTSEMPWVGGGGYVLNRKVVASRLLNSTLCNDIHPLTAEDMAVSTCLFRSGVVPRDSRDAEGHPRFCRNQPQWSCDMLKDRLSTDGYPSKYAVLWHYMTGQMRINVAKCFQTRSQLI